MQDNYLQQARQAYERAWRLGQKEYSSLTARGERGNLLVLDELTEEGRIMAYIRQPSREISLRQVVGTYTAARARSFSASFMPLHPPNSEFGSKWITLCAAHMGEGLRDPIQVYEYLWQYYVVEGNKRVSVLKYFDALTMRAEITRLVPQMDPEDPQTAIYHAFLRYDKEGFFRDIRLGSAERYQILRDTEQYLLKQLPPGTEKPNFNAMLLRFEGAYQRAGGGQAVGDAFYDYLHIFGFPLDVSSDELVVRIVKLAPQLALASHLDKQPTLLLDAQQELPQPGLVTRLFGGRRTAKVVFAYAQGRTEHNWIGAHEKGRLQMQQQLQDSVTSTCIDGLTAENAYERLSEQARGQDLLLVTSSHLAPAALRFSLENPDCITLVYSRVRQDYRLNTYYGRYYEPVFLCGVAAGLGTETGKVAYVTPHVAGVRHTADINAFALGVRSVRANAEVYLVMRGFDPKQPASCEKGIRQAVELGCDIALTPDYPGLSMIGTPEGAFSFLLRLHGMGQPSEYLAAPAWLWGRYYTQMVESYLSGSLDFLRYIDNREPTVTGFWWGLGAGVLEFKSTPFLPPLTNNLMHFIRSSIQLGRFNPFHGPIVDSEGTLRVPSHADLKPYDILSMQWLVDFIKVID